jgi:multiple sugar transport system permease protein
VAVAEREEVTKFVPQRSATYRPKKSRSIALWNGVRTGLLYLLLTAIGVVMLTPLLWMVSTSLKQRGMEFASPPQWIPHPIVWANYYETVTLVPFHLYFLNTVIITFFSTVGSLLTAAMVAYGFARIPFPGRRFLFVLLLSTLMLPYVVTLIPSFLLFKYLRWLDSFLPLIVPSFFGGSPFFIFLIRQFYATIPTDLDEAAEIDGAGYFRIWWSILLPLSRPALATVVIFSFIWNWNDFLGPLIYLN